MASLRLASAAQGGSKRLAATATASSTKKRGLAAFAPGHYERGFQEFGPGGRSSVAGITAALFGGTGFMGKYLQFEMGAWDRSGCGLELGWVGGDRGWGAAASCAHTPTCAAYTHTTGLKHKTV